jgi:hypothetical protein
MFARWGELQGQELHDAVKKYFEVIIDTRNLIGGLSTPIDVRRAAAAAELGKPMLGNLHAITDEMGLAFASMSKLTDVDDKIAAQEHLNELGRQYYKESADMLVNLLGMEKQFNAQDQSMLEQLDLTGLGDDKQAKLDFYYKHLTDARHDMLSATDPMVIAEIQQRANGYIQAAMGVAPDSKANLEQLRHIIGDLADIRNGKIESSIETEIAQEDQKAATMLQDAAKLLQGAANALNPGGETPAPGPDPQPGDDEPKLPKPIEQPLAGADSLLGSSSELHASSVALAEVTGNLRHLGEWASGGDDGPPGRTHLEEIRRALQMSEGARSRDVGDAVRTALEGLELTGTMVTQLDVDTGGLVDVAARAAEQRVVLRLKRNRDGLTSRIDGGR